VVFEEDADGAHRYKMLQTVRQYALEKLIYFGIEPAAKQRHRDFFLQFAERAAPELLRSGQSEWIRRLEMEHDNLRAALDTCRQDPDAADVELRLVGSAWQFWFFSSYLKEGRDHLTRALSRGSEPAALQAKALVGLGVIAYFQGDLATAQEACERALDPSEIADSWSLGVALIITGVLANYRGELAVARGKFEQSLDLARSDGDLWLEAIALSDLGFCALNIGDAVRARELCEQSLVIARKNGEKWCIFNSLYSLGLVTIARGANGEAREMFREAMSISGELGHKISIALCMDGLAGAWGAHGELERAALLFGAAAAWREKIGIQVPPAFRAAYDHGIAAVRAAMGDPAFEAKWSEGQTMSFEEAIDFALQEG
jgi:non-specific serine/threonine protein kinase